MTRKDRALQFSDFARSGLFVQRTATPPTRFQVLGERSSGTNFVKRLLGRNSALRPTETLGWKHGFPGTLAIPADLAVVCVVRNAADWALSMHAKPWHATPDLQALAFSDFIRAPWQTIVDRPRYFENSGEVVGQPLQQDRDPVTGTVFANLFALRRAKLTGLLSYLNRGCTCVVLRLDSLQSDPEGGLEDLLTALGQPRRTAPFRPITRRLGSRFKPSIPARPKTPDALSADDHAFLVSQLDPQQEATLGYAYSGDASQTSNL